MTQTLYFANNNSTENAINNLVKRLFQKGEKSAYDYYGYNSTVFDSDFNEMHMALIGGGIDEDKHIASITVSYFKEFEEIFSITYRFNSEDLEEILKNN